MQKEKIITANNQMNKFLNEHKLLYSTIIMLFVCVFLYAKLRKYIKEIRLA